MKSDNFTVFIKLKNVTWRNTFLRPETKSGHHILSLKKDFEADIYRLQFAVYGKNSDDSCVCMPSMIFVA